MEGDKEAIATWMRDNPDQQGSEVWNQAEQALRTLDAQALEQREPRTPLEMPEYKPTGMDNFIDNVYGSIPMRAAQGVARLPLGAMQLGMEGIDAASGALGFESDLGGRMSEHMQTAETMKRQGMANQGANYDVAGFAGEVAAPLGVAGKAGQLAKTLAGRIGQGGMWGAAAGASTPVNDNEGFWMKKALQTGLGGVLGAAVPAVTTVGRNLIDPFLPGGTRRATSRLLNEAAGDRPVREALENTASFSDDAMVRATPAGSAEFNAVLNEAGKRDPSAMADMAVNAANRRQGALHNIAGSPATTEALRGFRGAVTGPLYNAARNSSTPVNVSRSLSVIDDLITNNPGRRQVINPIRQVREQLLEPDGSVTTDPRRILSVIDDVKDMMASKTDNNPTYGPAMRFLSNIKDSLDDDVARVIPAQGQANSAFSQLSGPINRMEIGQELEQKFIPSLTAHGSNQAQAARH